MTKFKLFKNKSVISKWILSYIIILLLPITICGIGFLKVDQIVKNQINESNKFFLGQIQHKMDNMIRNVERISREIASNPDISDIFTIKNNEDINEKRYELIKATRILGIYNKYSEYASSNYVFLKSCDLVVSGTSNFTSKAYFDLIYSNEKKLYKSWYEMINRNYYKGEFVVLGNGESKASESYKERIFYLFSFPMWYKDLDMGNIVMLINNAEFNDIKNYIEETTNGKLIILDENDKIVYGSEWSKELGKLQYNDFNESGLIYDNQGGESRTVSYISSSFNKWKYIYVMPTKTYFEKTEYIRNLLLLSILIAVLIGLMVTWILSKKNYLPLNKIVKALSSELNIEIKEHYNEYNFIESAMERTLNNNKKINKEINDQRAVLIERFIERLLKGREKNSTLNNLIPAFNLRFYDNFFVMVLYFEDIEDCFYEKIQFEYRRSSSEMFKFIAKNILDEYIKDKGQVFVTEIDGMIVCLLDFIESGDESSNQNTKEIADEFISLINNYYKIKVQVAFSKKHCVLGNIPEAYNEALETMEYKLIMGIDNCVFYEELTEKPKDNYHYPLLNEHKLINSIKIGDFKNAAEVLDIIFEDNFEKRNLSLEDVKSLVFNIISTLIKSINQVEEIKVEDFSTELSSMEKLIYFKNIDELKINIKGSVINICERVISLKNGRGSKTKEEIVRFIEERYKDENLSISFIADNFELHPSYVSKIFKNDTGIGILDFINNVRIEKAKTLMRQQNMNLEEVSKAVGYNNTRTFSRAFTKCEGITPGRYKEINK